MLDGISNYPLTWPATWARTKSGRRQNSQFADRSVAKAVAFVLDEVRLLKATNVIISSNLQLRNDGLPRSGQKTPEDPGIAVYFILRGQPRVLACDKWLQIEDNLWAIGKHIEAIRGQERWGVGTIDQAFAGYEALPAPKSAWWEVLGVAQTADMEVIQSAYRALVKQHHPDKGGSSDSFMQVQKAFEQAKKDKSNQ
jgi:hypothetical protein